MASRRQSPAVPLKLKKRPVRARGMFDEEVAVEHHRLHARERGIVGVLVPPTALHDGHPRVGEMMDGTAQEVRRRTEIRVEDRDDSELRGPESGIERTRLEPGAIRPVEQHDVHAAAAPRRDAFGGDHGRVVRRIVEDLNLQAILRVVDRANRVEQRFDHVAFVEERQLHGDAGKFRIVEAAKRKLGLAARLEPAPQKRVTVAAVDGEQDEHQRVDGGEREHDRQPRSVAGNGFAKEAIVECRERVREHGNVGRANVAATDASS